MNSNTRKLGLLPHIVTLLIFGLGTCLFAQEHPEHPKDNEKKASTVTKEMMAEAIEGYIKKDTALKGGYFTIYDAKAKTTLALKLDKVHRDKLAMVKEDLYFACTDLKTADGKMYDLDFFMKPGDGGLEVSKVMIHKEAGTPRYKWQEKDGVWTTKK